MCSEKWTLGVIQTGNLPLRSPIHEPFVFKLRKSLTKTRVHTLHIVLEVLSL
jgi:hypothetical protein